MSSPNREFKCRVCGDKKTNPCDRDVGICQDCEDHRLEELKAQTNVNFTQGELMSIKDTFEKEIELQGHYKDDEHADNWIQRCRDIIAKVETAIEY